MATAEFAVALPAVVLVLVVGLTAIIAGIDQVRCVDAARLAARSFARGDNPADARALARRAAPGGASIEVTASGDLVTATVSVARRAPVLGVSWVVRSMAVAPREAVPP
ncbi:MAG: TadE family type IV pilus minor pilin [Anaerolineae bacterium]